MSSKNIFISDHLSGYYWNVNVCLWCDEKQSHRFFFLSRDDETHLTDLVKVFCSEWAASLHITTNLHRDGWEGLNMTSAALSPIEVGFFECSFISASVDLLIAVITLRSYWWEILLSSYLQHNTTSKVSVKSRMDRRYSYTHWFFFPQFCCSLMMWGLCCELKGLLCNCTIYSVWWIINHLELSYWHFISLLPRWSCCKCSVWD